MFRLTVLCPASHSLGQSTMLVANVKLIHNKYSAIAKFISVIKH